MSLVRFDRSPDLQHLRDDGYTVSVEETGYVLVRDVPYVTAAKAVERGILAYPVRASGNSAGPPDNHVVFFAGDVPHQSNGKPFGFHSPAGHVIAQDLVANLQLSYKDPTHPVDADLYVKFKRYITLLEQHAQKVEPGVTAALHRPVQDDDPESPFQYLDSASSRAGIVRFAQRLEKQRVAIVGLGGTGSYVLDLVAKTRVAEIHLFDGDELFSHNAFRAPGAASLGELNNLPKKVLYYSSKYSVLKRGIVPHPYYLTDSNASELASMDFVFLCMEGGEVKQQLVLAMEQANISFIDTSLDVLVMGDALGGTVQVTTSTPQQREHLRGRVSFAEPSEDDVYSSNIQVADLNALNAVMAVLKWKKLYRFYSDRRYEHFSVYGIEANLLASGDEGDGDEL